jgi:hypothetical protein
MRDSSLAMRILAEGFKKSHPNAKMSFVPGLGAKGLVGRIDSAL